RSGIPLTEIHRQMRGISSDRVVGLGPNKVMSVPDAIGLALEEWMRDKQGVQQELIAGAETYDQMEPSVIRTVGKVTPSVSGVQPEFEMVSFDGGEGFMGTCPDCGSQLEYAEGCVKCHVCGFSECG
ncbi:MAG: vitamin B12-dependent ribonucleotide reductase, partial [Gemmatimonadaceae bacterium]